MPKFAKKRDANERDIITAIERCGFLVHQIDDPRGFPDLVVQDPASGYVWLLEVKDRGGRLTASQKNMIVKGWRIHIVKTIQDALKAIGVDINR